MMTRQTLKRIALVVLFLGLSFGGWLGARADEAITSIGGTWAAKEVVWHELDGAYRGTMIFEPVQVQLASVDRAELVTSLCRSALKQIDAIAPDGVEAAQVYRLDLNIRIQNGTMAFDRFVLMSVADAQCEPPTVNGTYFPTYPAPIRDWYVSGIVFLNTQEGERFPAVRFENRPGTQPTVSSFDPIFACAALREDPALWDLSQHQFPLEGKVQVIALVKGDPGSDAANAIHNLIIEDGVCRVADPT